jgi:hypothetical protein
MSLSDLASNVPGSPPPYPSFNPLTALPDARGYLDTLTNAYILKPANAKGIGGFVFDYEGETSVSVDSEISDHYTEQNVFINDQAAQRPIRITLRGFVGELVSNPNVGLLGALNVLQTKLGSLSAIGGKYTPSVVQKIAAGVTSAQSVVNTIDTTISKVQNVVGLFVGSSPATTRQEQAYWKLYSLWTNNTVFTLVTPFNYMTSVMIEHMMFVQEEETKTWSEISVTLKQVRFLQPLVGPGLPPQLASQNVAGRASAQIQGQTNNGQVGGTQTPFGGSESFFGFGGKSSAAA